MDSDVDTDSAVEDTAPATSEHADNGTPDTTQGSAPANGAGSEQPQGSLTQPHTEEASQSNPNGQQRQTPTGQPSQPQADNWQDRYKHLQSATDRKLAQAKRDQQQFQQELQSLRDFQRQQQETAQRQNLRQWNKQHPENRKFQGMLERAKAVDAQLRSIDPSLPPEVQAASKAAIMSALAPEEQQQLQQYREEVTQFQRGFFEDPQGTLTPLIQPMIAEAIRAEHVKAQADMRVGQEFSSPDLQPLVEAHAPQLRQALEDGVPYEYATHMLRMYGELEKMRTQMGSLTKQAAMGTEQVRLAQGNAAITRDPSPARNVDVYTLAKQQAATRGFSTADPRFLHLLADLERANKP